MTPSDDELLHAARHDDEAAFAELYVRHHAAARRLAASYRRGGEVDDLVNGAFERVLGATRRGSGPRESFRAYLFVTLRRLAMEAVARNRDDTVDEVPEPDPEDACGFELEHVERELIIGAFESLPVHWQEVLWHTAVEGRPPREIADMDGLSANATSALASRAREKLRQAYLQAHLQTSHRPQCEPHRSRLGAYVRDGLGQRDRQATAQHLAQCEACRSLVNELTDVNRIFIRSMPLFQLAPGAASATAASAAGAAPTPTGVASPLGGTWSGIRRTGAAVAGAAAVAATAVMLAVTTVPDDETPTNRAPASLETGPAPSGAVGDAPPCADRGESGGEPTSTDTSTTTTETDPILGPDC